MAEKYISEEKTRTRQGNLVTPLDAVRQYQENTCTIVSGTSGALMTGESGKVYYIRQMLVCEESGHAGNVQLRTVSVLNSGTCLDDRLSPWIPVDENACVCWDICPCALGPICPNSGTNNAVIRVEALAFSGEITLVLTVDPHVVE